MVCPKCGDDTSVIYSYRDNKGVYRRRKCLGCDYRFYTTEVESDGVAFNRLNLAGQYERKRRRLKSSDSDPKK